MISLSEKPQSLSTSAVCSPSLAAPRVTSGRVRLKRGAGAGCSMPLMRMKLWRAVAWGCLRDSSRERTGAKQESLPSNTSHHSCRVFVLKSTAKRSFHFDHSSPFICWVGSRSSMPRRESSSA